MSTLPPDSARPAAQPSGTDHDALPPGTRFGEFEIVRVLGVGGFGIVYLAKDHSLERDVALKEYMPASLAARGQGPQITVRSSAFAETYAIGLRSFVNEARLLARFDHPSLVKVYRFWEDNATAYMVMPFLQGTTLRDTRRAMAHPPNEAWVRSVIAPILSALELLHREGVYHRDIAPDNILLPHDGPPVLLDFGAARRVISDRTQSLTAILKPSYAPIEQYAEMAQMRQGPWTDLYALGAVIHYLLFGRHRPPPRHAPSRTTPSRSRAGSSRACRRASWRRSPGCCRCGPTSGRRTASSCVPSSTGTHRSRRAGGPGSRSRCPVPGCARDLRADARGRGCRLRSVAHGPAPGAAAHVRCGSGRTRPGSGAADIQTQRADAHGPAAACPLRGAGHGAAATDGGTVHDQAAARHAARAPGRCDRAGSNPAAADTLGSDPAAGVAPGAARHAPARACRRAARCPSQTRHVDGDMAGRRGWRRGRGRHRGGGGMAARRQQNAATADAAASAPVPQVATAPAPAASNAGVLAPTPALAARPAVAPPVPAQSPARADAPMRTGTTAAPVAASAITRSAASQARAASVAAKDPAVAPAPPNRPLLAGAAAPGLSTSTPLSRPPSRTVPQTSTDAGLAAPGRPAGAARRLRLCRRVGDRLWRRTHASPRRRRGARCGGASRGRRRSRR
jgi:hypothetical protein